MTDLQRPPSILENRTLNRLVTPLSKMGNFLLCSNPPVPAHVSKQPGYIGELSVEEPVCVLLVAVKSALEVTNPNAHAEQSIQ